MSQLNKEMDFSSLTQDQQDNLQYLQYLFEQHKQNQLVKREQQKLEQQQQEQNKQYNAQSQSLPCYHNTPQQNYSYTPCQPNGYPKQLPENRVQPELPSTYQTASRYTYCQATCYSEKVSGKAIQHEYVRNYQIVPHYAHFQPNGYPEKTPEKHIHPEPAPNYQNTPGQVHEGDHGLGQHNPNYAYYHRSVYPEKLSEKMTCPGSELNYQAATGQAHESDHGLGQQYPKIEYYRPHMYPGKFPERGILPRPGTNYRNAPHHVYYQPLGYPEMIPREGILPKQALNYQTASGQGHGSVYNVGKRGRQNGDSSYQAPQGLTPVAEAAVVALTQLVQFAESMDSATCTGQGQQGPLTGLAAPPVYLGSSRRGGIPFRRTALGRGCDHNHEEPKPETLNLNKAPIASYSCVLCKVDCNGLHNLEQHHNSKKHKKNMEKAGQVQPLALTKKSESVNGKTTKENAGIESSERGTKRKISEGKNGKKKRKANGLPKLVIPKICDLCNVKCDTQEMYDCHVVGKKHMSKVKRYEGHRSMYGPVGLQALYPPILQTLTQQQSPQQGTEPGDIVPPQALSAAETVITGVESSASGLSS